MPTKRRKAARKPKRAKKPAPPGKVRVKGYTVSSRLRNARRKPPARDKKTGKFTKKKKAKTSTNAPQGVLF